MHAQRKKKHVLQMPLAPKQTIGLLTTLTGDKLSALKELGFDCLLQVRCKMWNHKLCKYVIHLFDPNARTMLIDGTPRVITERDVENILGLKSNGVDVPCGGRAEDVNFLFQQVAIGKVLKVSDLEAPLRDPNALVDGIFKARLVLYIIATLLSPNMRRSIRHEFIYAVQDVNQVRNLNWGKFVLDHLCKNVRRFKKNNLDCISGCMLFLMLYFANAVAAGKDVVRQQDETVPRCRAWTDKNLLKLWKLLCIKPGTKGTEGCEEIVRKCSNMHAQKKKKNYLEMPFAPKRTIGLLTTLMGDKLSALEELGFNCLLQVRCKMWNHELCRYVIDLFDPNSRTMLIDGTPRVITERDVENILGLNSNGADVPCGGCAEDVNCLFQQVAMGKVLKVRDLEAALKDPNAVFDGIFKARLVLYIIATLLSPKNTSTLPMGGFNLAIQDVNQVKNLNWGKFVLDRLCESICRFKTKNSCCVSGCVLFLMLYFANAVAAGKDVVRQQDETIPRCRAWTDENLLKLWKLLRIKSGTKETECREEIVKKWSNMRTKRKKKYYLEMPFAPKRTIGLLTTLTGDKLSALEELGFNCLLQVQCKMWNHKLCRYVIDLFDPNAHTMLIDGKPRVITERDVENILGLNSSGADVPCGGCAKDANYLFQQVAMGKVLKVRDLEAALKDPNAAVDGIFKARLVLYIIATLLSPTNMSIRLIRRFNLAIQDVNQVRNLNWGKFVFDRLCESIRRFKTKNPCCVSGCVLFLMLYFANAVAAGKDVVRQQDETIPRCRAWTDENLLKLWKLLRIKSGTKETEESMVSSSIVDNGTKIVPQGTAESEHSPGLRALFAAPKRATHGKRKEIEVEDPSGAQKRSRPNDRWAEFPPYVRSTIPARTPHPGHCPYDDTAKAILNYAFDDSLDIMEILCDIKHDYANRRAMLSLRPNCWVSSSIIDTVAARCNMLEVSIHPDWRRWFFPSRFASMRESDVSTQEAVLLTAKKFRCFMHDISTCDWVHSILKEHRLWSSSAYEAKEKCVYVLDTEHPRSHVKRSREHIYRRTLQLLQAVLLHKAHEKMLQPGFVEDLSDWAFVYPKGVPNQCSFGDYDGCGVYVIKFMQCENLLEDIVGMEAKMYDRFSIVVSLVDWESNARRASVITSALAHYKSNSKPRVKKRVRAL